MKKNEVNAYKLDMEYQQKAKKNMYAKLPPMPIGQQITSNNTVTRLDLKVKNIRPGVEELTRTIKRSMK